ncbi:lyase family protein [Promicromonospora sukumoe]|uniref:lyase family protein n=1 Tax=Promicromonospora sukumoe TaxID=88382 RepID=UPI003669A5A2
MPDVGLLTPGADLAPGSPAAVTDDVAVLRAMLRAEAAWVRVVVRHRAARPGSAPDPGADTGDADTGDADTGDADTGAAAAEIDAVVERLAGADDNALALATGLARAAAAGGNPVIPLVAALREAAGPRLALVVHAGLTSQDVLDTALVLVLRDAADGVVADLDRAAAAAARLAAEHRARPALARTLAQAAVPTTLGARFAGWLQGILAARAFLAAVSDALPLAYGGAAGELSGVLELSDVVGPRDGAQSSGGVGLTEGPGQLEGSGQSEGAGRSEGAEQSGGAGQSENAGRPERSGQSEGAWRSGGDGSSGSVDGSGSVRPAFDLVEAWGAELGLPVGPAPWHVTRTPVVRVASALAETCTALGKVANDVLQAVRPGVDELREPAAPGRGASSAMAHKRNPVLSVLVRRSAIAAPHPAAQVLSAAALAVDERSDGAWHAEWPALQQLARHAVGSAHAAAELLEGLEVDAEAVARNLRQGLPDAGPVPDAGSVPDAKSVLDVGPVLDVGAAAAVVDRVLHQYAEQTRQDA